MSALYYVLNSSWIWEKVIPKMIRSQINTIDVQSFKMKNQKIALTGQISLENIALSLKSGEDMYHVDVQGIYIDPNLWLSSSPQKIQLNVKGLNVKSALINFSKADLELSLFYNQNSLESLTGVFAMNSGDIHKYRWDSLKINIMGDSKHIILDKLLAQFYEGTMEGKINLEYRPSLIYDIDIHFDQVNLGALKQANEAIFSKLRGKARGEISIKANPQQIELLKVSVDVPKDAQIKASLLKPFIAHIPPSTQRKDLDLLIKLDGSVALDKALMTMESVNKEKLKTHLVLESKRFNFNFDMGADIGIEGGLKQLLDMAVHQSDLQRQIFETLIQTFTVESSK